MFFFIEFQSRETKSDNEFIKRITHLNNVTKYYEKTKRQEIIKMKIIFTYFESCCVRGFEHKQNAQSQAQMFIKNTYLYDVSFNVK
jgi:hypothetical protein